MTAGYQNFKFTRRYVMGLLIDNKLQFPSTTLDVSIWKDPFEAACS